MKQRVALLGLSGVGKTTLVARVAEKLPVLHLQASNLIKTEQVHRAQLPGTSEALRLGPVIDNQALMITAFLRVAADSTLPIVLDAHSIIDGRDGIVEIPSEVFAALDLVAICFMADNPDVIAQRRLGDTGRERPIRTPEVLADHQELARAAAKRIATDIRCPFIAIRGDDIERMIQLLS